MRGSPRSRDMARSHSSRSLRRTSSSPRASPCIRLSRGRSPRSRSGYACGPWSQGPLVPMTLNLLEGYDVASMGPGSLAFLHTYTEAFKLAAADREGFFGDPDQVDVPIRGLLDKGYAQERRDLIRDDRAWPELPLPGDPWKYEGRTGPAGYVPRLAAGVGGPATS